MWIRKIDRDLKKGVDSPMPTQVVSNEEFLPRPQTQRQKQLEELIGEMGDARARKLNIDRRAFMASSMGLATCFAASNRVYGKVFDVDEAETCELAAIDEKYPKSEYFVIDVQAHFTNGIALNFRNSETARNMGFSLKDDVESYSFKNFVKEMFFDSETNMVVISGVPTREIQRAPDGKVLEGAAAQSAVRDPAELADGREEERDQRHGRLAARAVPGQPRAEPLLGQGDQHASTRPRLIEQMERELQLYKIDSWKWYCHTDPARTGNGFQLDDDNAMWFYEESRKRGMKLISVHKGYSYQSRTLGHLANPKDVEKAALANPDFNFVDLPLGDQARPERAELPRQQQVRSEDRRLRVALDPDGHQEAQSADEQRLSRGRQLLQRAGGHRPGAVHARHGQEHQALRRRPRRLGHRLPVVGLAAVGDRSVQALRHLRRVRREVRLPEDQQGRTRRRSSA